MLKENILFLKIQWVQECFGWDTAENGYVESNQLNC